MNRHRYTASYSETVAIPIIAAIAGDFLDWLDAHGIMPTLTSPEKTTPEIEMLMRSDDWSYEDLAKAYVKHLEGTNG